MARVVRPVGYTGGLQQLVWPASASTVTAYLWGAGGGGGGDEGSDDPGGNGVAAVGLSAVFLSIPVT